MAVRVGLKRQQVVEAAARIADRLGADKVTLTAVAEQLGVRTPSLYNHIQGLPELRSELAVWGTQQLKEEIREAAVGKAQRDAVLAIAHVYREFAHRRPGLYRAIIATPDRDCQAQRLAIEGLMGVIKAVLQGYGLAGAQLIHAVRGLRSLMHGFVTLEDAGWFVGAVERNESYLQLIETFIGGIENK